MTGSQKFALVLGAGSLMLFAVAVFMFIKGPSVDAKIAQIIEKSKPRPMADILIDLNREAAARGVYYDIYCTAYYEGDPEKWRGIATPKQSFNIYIEDGAAPYWHSGVKATNSKEEAGEQLLMALRGEPNAMPQHRRRERDAECPSITGPPMEAATR